MSFLPSNFFLKYTLTVCCLLLLTFNNGNAQSLQQKQIVKNWKLALKINKITDSNACNLYIDSVLQIAQSTNDLSFKAQIFYAISKKEYKKGDSEKALKYAQNATEISSQDDSLTYVRAPLMTAFMLNRLGKDDLALKIAFKLLHTVEQKGWKRLSIECRNCIADIYRTRHDVEKALPYAEQSSADALELRDTAAYIYSLSTLSNIYSTDARDAPEKLLKAAVYLEKIFKPPFVNLLTLFDKAKYLSNLGRLYEMLGKYQLAEQILQQSISISQEGGFNDLKQHALNEMMTLKLRQHSYQAAVKFGEMALKSLPESSTGKVQLRNIFDRLAEATSSVQDYKKAFYYTSRSKEISQALNSEDKVRITEELDKSFKTDKRIIQAEVNSKLLRQEINLIIILTIVALLICFLVYRWMLYKKNLKAEILAEKNAQLTKVDKMKTSFLANVSHELRTPLTLIVGHVDQLRNAKDHPLTDVDRQNYLGAVWLNSKKMLEMFNELLEITKIESVDLPINSQRVEIHEQVMLSYQTFHSLANYKNISFSIDCLIERGVTMEIDLEKFQKILHNLIVNALKFTPKDGLVKISVQRLTDGIEIQVADTGPGIAEENFRAIFDRYYQIEGESKILGGTGVGLSIAKEYTELLGGSISVKSKLGEGSVFTIFLPVIFGNGDLATDHMEFSAQKSVPNVSTEDVSGTTNTGSKRLILLVEDHLEMSIFISSILKPLYQVEVAINGNDAIEKLESFEVLPSLIISDVMMPGMDGMELLRFLKTHESYFLIPVIMLTALADAASKLQALNFGVDDYLVKPFLTSELIARTGNLIENSLTRSNHQVNLVMEDASEIELEEASPSDLLWLKRLEQVVRDGIKIGDARIASISYQMAISERQFHRTVKSITGLTPNKYIRNIRLQIAREAIRTGKYKTVAEIAYLAGFETPAYFSKLFKEHFGRDVNDIL